MPGITTKGKIRNLASLVVYAALAVVTGYFFEKYGKGFEDVSVWEWIIMALATCRFTSIPVYGCIFRSLRDFIRADEGFGLMVSLKSLITCPWCAGVWAALEVFVLQYFVPYGYVLNILLSLAGVDAFVPVRVNLIGLKNEKSLAEVRKPGFSISKNILSCPICL
ncbi:MAG TPA: DUF1360 domain-containing protein [Bacteroidetes bacterium]|nr:DUF1360 domain-containing protein [Bacteroidota bacterium]